MRKIALAVLRVFTVVLTLVLTRGTAGAALKPSYDLTSLGFKASHVVRAKPTTCVPLGRRGPWSRRT